MPRSMPSSKPHWSPDADFSSCPFFIRRMDTVGYSKPAEAPAAQLPLISFIYVSSGEVLVDVDGSPFLCQPGQILLIPQQQAFAIRFYRSAIGYTGGFAPSSLPDSKPLRYLSAPLHQGFWFDEGAFMAELLNMLAISFEKGDQVFVEKGLDLLLSRIKPNLPATIPAAVSSFLESVFDPNRMPGTIASYAEEAGIRENESYEVNFISRGSDMLVFELETEWTVTTCYADMESTQILGLMTEAKTIESLLDETAAERCRTRLPLKAA